MNTVNGGRVIGFVVGPGAGERQLPHPPAGSVLGDVVGGCGGGGTTPAQCGQLINCSGVLVAVALAHTGHVVRIGELPQGVRAGWRRAAVVSDPLDGKNARALPEVEAGVGPQVAGNSRTIEGDHFVVPTGEHGFGAFFKVGDKNLTLLDGANQIMESLRLRSARLAGN